MLLLLLLLSLDWTWEREHGDSHDMLDQEGKAVDRRGQSCHSVETLKGTERKDQVGLNIKCRQR